MEAGLAATGKEPPDGGNPATGRTTMAPINRLITELKLHILSFLPHDSICVAARLSRGWNALCDQDGAWASACASVLMGKKHTDRYTAGRGWKAALRSAIADQKRRKITVEELVSIEWFFSYKSNIPHRMMQFEPFFEGRSPRRRQFDRSGHLVSLTPDLEPFPIQFWRWRLHSIERFRALESSNDDSLQRVSYYGQMRLPELTVRRLRNWGWVLESSVAIFASFPLAEYIRGPDCPSPFYPHGSQLEVNIRREAAAAAVGEAKDKASGGDAKEARPGGSRGASDAPGSDYEDLYSSDGEDSSEPGLTS